ncbi:hypothetical protein DPEC_G00156880 [Dallia pectoralis]|uniref:Uncharacterized protein n=1 Tax=Dallia pectoralis TaxID=75939 RepID=A0ACC2GL33_DALPE|nr:hypothetical protein DPEC_G00156880 [Dallia pectoralis]
MLCHDDGTPWPKGGFEREHATLSEIKDVWKKTFFVGRRSMAGHRRTHLDEEQIDEEAKQAIGFQICLVAEYIHSKNIIHQDIKPGNIIVEEKGMRAFLTDWGMANIHDVISLKIGSQTIVPPAGPLGGTIFYWAPECELHYCAAIRESDVWSVGATFVELFTGSRPWNVKQPREVKALLSSRTEPHALAMLSPTWKDIISQCLRYEPEQRPTAGTLAKVFRSGLDLNCLGW